MHLAEPLGVIVYSHRTSVFAMTVQVIGAEVTYWVMFVMSMLGWSSFVQVKGFTKQCR